MNKAILETPAGADAPTGATPPLPASSAKRAVRSFDIFDTLIARDCIDARSIFARVEALTKNPGFAADRVAAEQRVFGGSYTMDDIYEELMKIRGWTPQQRDAAQAAEIFLELEAVTPIAENLALVRDGDVAVSDMYLPEEVIRMLLKKAGLAKEIGLVVSSHGKSSGKIWPLLQAHYEIEEHLGDNQVSDVQSPQGFGIVSRHTKIASPDGVETWFLQNGFRGLAQIVRQARLSTWHDDPVMRQLQLIQSRFNFPILLLSSILLARFLAANKIQNVLFCSRDCNLWIDLFRAVRQQIGVETGESYFYTSRLARMKSSPSYRRYAEQALKGGSLLVDVCGTGWSLSHMLRGLGVQTPVFFIHHLPKTDVYEQMRPTPEGMTVHSVMKGWPAGVNNQYLEAANYADHPQIVDVCYVNDSPHPVFAPERRPEAVLSMIRAQRNSFKQAVGLVESQGLGEAMHASDEALRAMVQELYGSLCKQRLLPATYDAMHRAEEDDQIVQLRMMS